MKNKRKWITLSVITLALVITIGLSIFVYRAWSSYALIREAVESKSITSLLTETRKSRTNECYPNPEDTYVCRIIIYKFASADCAKIVSKIQGSSRAGDSCKEIRESQTYKNANLTYSVSIENGEHLLYVLYVSRN